MDRADNINETRQGAGGRPSVSWSTTEEILGRVVANLRPMRRDTAAAGRSSAAPPERRRYPREPMQLAVEVFGYDGDLSLVHAYGRTDNVSRQGLLASVDLGLPVGARAVVTVRSPENDVSPRILRGQVVRCQTAEGAYGLALRLDHDVHEWPPHRIPSSAEAIHV